MKKLLEIKLKSYSWLPKGTLYLCSDNIPNDIDNLYKFINFVNITIENCPDKIVIVSNVGS